MSAEYRIRALNWPDPRFAGIRVSACLVIGHDKRQKSPLIVDVYDDITIKLLRLMYETQPVNDERLFKASAPTLRRNLKTLCKDLGFTHLGILSHSFRYDGTVYYKDVRGILIGHIEQRDRWQEAETFLL